MDTFRGNLQLATVRDLDRLIRFVARLGLDVLNLGHDIKALQNLAENDVLAIKPAIRAQVSSAIRIFICMEEARGILRGDDGGDEELRAVGILASVGHGQ